MPWFGPQLRMDQLVEEHYASLYRFAYRLSGSQADAEDLTQETFCQAQKKWAQLRDMGRVRGWLFAILRNAYLHKLRESKKQETLSLADWNDYPERLPDSGIEVDPAALQEALSALPENFRTPLILYYFEEFSYREIAEQLEIPLGTVMSRLARGREFLRQRMVQGTDVAPSVHGDSR